MSETWTMAGIGGGTVIPIAEVVLVAAMAGLVMSLAKVKRLLMFAVQAALTALLIIRANAAEAKDGNVGAGKAVGCAFAKQSLASCVLRFAHNSSFSPADGCLIAARL